MNLKPLFCLMTLFLLPAATSFAQEKAAEGKVDEKLPDIPEVKACLESRAKIDAVQAEIQAIFDKAKTLTANDREEIEKLQASYDEKAKMMAKLLVETRKTSLAAFEKVPTSTTIADTLLRIAGGEIAGDKNVGAYEIISLLIKNDSKVEGLYDAAAKVAYATDRFEDAKRYLEKSNELKETPRFSRELSAGSLDGMIADWKKEQGIRAAEAKANDLPRVMLETTNGKIVIELFENEAPQAVANFVSLVEKKYYDGLVFHRVLPGFMAQGGCPEGSGRGGPGYKIYCECQKENFRKHFSGTLSMAHAGKDTGGSQFFLTFQTTPFLDGRHTAFGRIVEGMDALGDLQKIDPQRPSGVEPSKILKAVVVRKRDHEYVPTKVK